MVNNIVSRKEVVGLVVVMTTPLKGAIGPKLPGSLVCFLTVLTGVTRGRDIKFLVGTYFSFYRMLPIAPP